LPSSTDPFLKCEKGCPRRVTAHVDQTDDRQPRLLDICCPDHLAPFIREFNDMFAELLGRACKNRVAKFGNPQLDSGISKTSVDCLVELLDDLSRRVPRSANSVPARRIIARYEFSNRRHIRQRFRACCGSHRQGAQLTPPDILDQRCEIPKVRLHLSAE